MAIERNMKKKLLWCPCFFEHFFNLEKFETSCIIFPMVELADNYVLKN